MLKINSIKTGLFKGGSITLLYFLVMPQKELNKNWGFQLDMNKNYKVRKTECQFERIILYLKN